MDFHLFHFHRSSVWDPLQGAAQSLAVRAALKEIEKMKHMVLSEQREASQGHL